MSKLSVAVTPETLPLVPTTWTPLLLAEVKQAAQLAAIVVSQQDVKALNQAHHLVQQAGLTIPIIPVDVTAPLAQIHHQIDQAATRYYQREVPQFLTDLMAFADRRPISLTTPGHHNGLYTEKHPAGYLFNHFFGSSFLYADTSDTVAELGDTMTHEGTPLTAEQRAAQGYHADKVYFCTNGTTSANTICAAALLTPGDLVLFDRNNHKSLYNSALVMTGARPVYLPTDRNPLGLIGEMLPEALTESSIRQEIAKVDPKKAGAKRPFRLAVVQLETYDGVFYQAQWLLKRLGPLCDYILFDCAWGGYEQFSPLLKDLSPLQGHYGPDDPGILVTQSIHKQQAGVAQTSQILKKDAHLKGQARYVDHKHFNHAYLKYVTSSYSYPIYASLTVNAYLATSAANQQWWQELAVRSINFRKDLWRQSQLFKPFIPPTVDGRSWLTIPTSELATQSHYWDLSPTDLWHGFRHIAANQARLDPFKLTITTPGVDYTHQTYTQEGIPGPIVGAFLKERGIIRGKDDLNSLLFLLTPGDDATVFAALLKTLLAFEELYKRRAPLTEALPSIAARYPERYRGYTLYQLCQEMHAYYQQHTTFHLQQALFDRTDFQQYELLPQQADWAFTRGESELCSLEQLEGRIALEGGLPYPPGVFVVAPGERWQALDCRYFDVLLGAIARFDGFVPEIQGVYYQQDDQGQWHMQAEVLSESSKH